MIIPITKADSSPSLFQRANENSRPGVRAAIPVPASDASRQADSFERSGQAPRKDTGRQNSGTADSTDRERSSIRSDIREILRQARPPGQQEESNSSEASSAGAPGSQALTDEEQKVVDELRRIDREVRAHEAAHQGAAGSLARGKSFSYQTGPDGKRYAVGGEVRIDISPVPGDPQATIQKMQRVRRAALAPAEPSPQDRAIASQASRQEAQARAELLKETTEGTISEAGTDAPQSPERSAAADNAGANPQSDENGENLDFIPAFTYRQDDIINRFNGSDQLTDQGRFLNALA